MTQVTVKSLASPINDGIAFSERCLFVLVAVRGVGWVGMGTGVGRKDDVSCMQRLVPATSPASSLIGIFMRSPSLKAPNSNVNFVYVQAAGVEVHLVHLAESYAQGQREQHREIHRAVLCLI